MLPLIPPNYPKIPAPDVLQEYKSFFSPFGSFWDLLGLFWASFGPKLEVVTDQSCDHSKRPQEEQNSDGNGFGSQFEDTHVILGSFGTIWDHLGSFGTNWDHLGLFLRLNVKLWQTCLCLGSQFYDTEVILGSFGTFGMFWANFVILGSFRVRLSSVQLSGAKMSQDQCIVQFLNSISIFSHGILEFFSLSSSLSINQIPLSDKK